MRELQNNKCLRECLRKYLKKTSIYALENVKWNSLSNTSRNSPGKPSGNTLGSASRNPLKKDKLNRTKSIEKKRNEIKNKTLWIIPRRTPRGTPRKILWKHLRVTFGEYFGEPIQ